MNYLYGFLILYVLMMIIMLILIVFCRSESSASITKTKRPQQILDLQNNTGEIFTGDIMPWEFSTREKFSKFPEYSENMNLSRLNNNGHIKPHITIWEKENFKMPKVPKVFRSVICLISNQFQRSIDTVKTIREKGQWDGDVLLITTRDSNFQDFDLSEFTHIFLLDMIPPESTSVSRTGRALFQQFKIYLFHPKLREYWDVVMYIDSGMEILQPIAPIFTTENWTQRFCAHSDSHPNYKWDLNTQFEHLSGDPEIPYGDQDYFQTGFMIFDTQKLCYQITIDKLLTLFKTYPNHKHNEQSIMNILLRNVWQPLTTDRNLLDLDGYVSYNCCRNDYSIARMLKKDCKERMQLEQFYLLHGIVASRKPRMEKEFLKGGIDPNHVKWILWPNKSDLTEQFIQSVVIPGSSITTGGIACTYKHYLCLKDIVEQNFEYAVIMEDNMGFLDNINVMDRLARYIGELNQFYPDWDVLFDNTYMHMTEHPIEKNRFVYPKSLNASPGSGGASRVAQFYLIRQKAAQKLLSKYIPFGLNPDLLMNELFRELNLQVFWSEPPMVATEENHVSSTQT